MFINTTTFHVKRSCVRVRYRYNLARNGAYYEHCFIDQLGVNFLPHELQGSISELREIEMNAKIEGVFVIT